MPIALRLYLTVVTAFFLCFAPPALADRKIALVIGNGDYQNISPLTNPVNDAATALAMLRGLGFETQSVTNVDKTQIEAALGVFHAASEGAEVALLYFAGHGIQAENRNYLLGVDTVGDSLDTIAETGVNMDQLIDAFSPDVGTKLLFVDACRNNPFTSAERSLGGVSRGLARSNHTSADLLVVYAAQPSKTALDGAGENSPFMEAISAALEPSREVRLSDALIEITNRVRTETRGRQIPYIEGSLSKNVIFTAASTTPAPSRAIAACQGTTAALNMAETVDENFSELSGADTNILIDDHVNVCLANDSLQISGPFPAELPCEAFMGGDGVGYYFADAEGAASHLWFYVDPASSENILQMGVYRGEDQLRWIWTGTPVCR